MPEKKLVTLFNNLRNQICTSYVTMSQMQAAVAADVKSVKQEFESNLKAKEDELQTAITKATTL